MQTKNVYRNSFCSLIGCVKFTPTQSLCILMGENVGLCLMGTDIGTISVATLKQLLSYSLYIQDTGLGESDSGGDFDGAAAADDHNDEDDDNENGYQ
ncbi:hypothetical protein SNE40_007279 [Patella caerulea]|uniref:Uncharacterized protein n=1 Tax=Patella caerulea TaxID=87958 RepID=A0AAN8Q246_PATCE